MIKIYKNSTINKENNERLFSGRWPLIFIFGAFLLFPSAAAAQPGGNLTLSITPPLIKNNVNPGQVWQSAIKVVNNTAAETDIYVQVKDFTSGEETGTVRFLESDDAAGAGHLLSGWLTVEEGPYPIEAFGSREIPVRVEVPDDAGPGGHYAAILAGTKPPAGAIEGSGIKISSLLASLLLLTIKGDINEQGQIREFSTDKSVYSEPNVTFKVRFENTGNVHIQPQGEIRITNLFGEEKARLTINHATEFGNVLPGTIRRWHFAWQEKKSLFDMGRYRAELYLSYGSEARETVNQTIYFWIIYYKFLAGAFAGLAVFAFIFVWWLRRYIRRAIARTKEQNGLKPPPFETKIGQNRVVLAPAQPEAVAVRKTITDIREKRPASQAAKENGNFRRYFMLSGLVLLAITATAGYFYFQPGETAPAENAERAAAPETENSRDFIGDEPIIIMEEDELEPPGVDPEAEIADGPEAADEEPAAAADSAADAIGPDDDEPAAEDEIAGETPAPLSVTVRNGSGISGAAREAAGLIEGAGYVVGATGNADNFNYVNTVIRYRPQREREAVEISRLFPAPVELAADATQSEEVIVIIGRNFK